MGFVGSSRLQVLPFRSRQVSPHRGGRHTKVGPSGGAARLLLRGRRLRSGSWHQKSDPDRTETNIQESPYVKTQAWPGLLLTGPENRFCQGGASLRGRGSCLSRPTGRIAALAKTCLVSKSVCCTILKPRLWWVDIFHPCTYETQSVRIMGIYSLIFTFEMFRIVKNQYEYLLITFLRLT